MTSRGRPWIRWDELRLAFLAALLSIVGAWTISVSASGSSTLTIADLRPAFVFSGAILVALIVWNVTRFSGDQIVFPVVAMLAGIGYVVLLRLKPDVTALDPSQSVTAGRQAIFIVAGITVMIAFGRFFRWWHLLRRYRYTLLLLCIGMLLSTLVFGVEIYGAKLWIKVGPILIQPSEFIKIGLVLFLAAYLDEHRDLMDAQWRLGPLRFPPIPYLLPMALMWATSLLVLVFENDLGSALLLFGIFLVMVYCGTGRPFYVLVGLVSFALACWVALSTFDRIGIRVQNWLDPWQDPLVNGFQPIQSDFAIASGGALGTGLGQGEPWRIPIVQTDFIFSAISEELGLVGAFAVLGLYGVLVARGFRIALRSRDGYLRLVAAGLSATLGIQTAVILGGVLRLIPLTGITLPFVSYGGSSMLTNFLIVGMLANISATGPRVKRSAP